MDDPRTTIRQLERGAVAPEAALDALTASAWAAPTWATRVEACRGIGAIAGRAHGASWPLAERAAFVLLDVARETDTHLERAQMLSAIGRAYRNVWLMPYVHARLGDDDLAVRAAAIAAAGGLGFPALEEALASDFLTAEVAAAIRLAAIAALGRMGAESAAARIATFVGAPGPESLAALAALTEIRSPLGAEAATRVLDEGPPPDLLAACVRYLAEIGHERVHRAIRSLARDDDAAQRIASSRAARAFQLERSRDAGERILSALTETDRATRAALARRLRTLPVDDVLAQARLLLADDPEGVVQIVSEVRAPEVTRMLLGLAADRGQPRAVRARAAGSIEANERWEQDALFELVASVDDVSVRVAAIQTLGAFAPLARVLEGLSALAGHAAPELRGALLWALQLAARPTRLEGPERARAEAIVRGALSDPEPAVRRRAAYVAGNLDARSLVPALLDLARREDERADLRLSAFVGLAEMTTEERLADVVLLLGREDDPAAISAASRALERAALGPAAERAPIARLGDRLPKLAAHADPRVRAAAARVAGLAEGTLRLDVVRSLATDASPRVREAAVIALGRLGGAGKALASAVEDALVSALDDDDVLIQERAADALVSLGLATSLRAVLEYVTETADEAAASRIADRLVVPAEHGPFLEALGAALARIDGDHAAYETLLELKIQALDTARRDPARVSGTARDVDADIALLFPHWARLSAVRGFAPLAKSLRTAEVLFGSVAGSEADPSASIVLWTKSLEGYLHAWLSPRLATLERQPAALFDVTERALSAWPSYQRWITPRWADPVDVGELRVDVPLRATVNVLRDLGERRARPSSGPASVTEWARLMMFLAVDHPSGPRNVLEVTCRDPDHAVRLAHRLQVLALVRNAVTHRAVAATSTLAAFRTLYYEAFEDVTRMA